MRTGKVNLRAFSKDGYIINQQLLQSVPYGMKQSNNNGCGWIAAYNFLHGFGRKKSWDTVRQQMEDTLLFGGLLGTHVVQLYLYLRRHGFPLRWSWGQKRARLQAEQCTAGILFYYNGYALHFVTFFPVTPEEREQISSDQAEPDLSQAWYRFLNGRMGKQQDYDTMEHFLQTESQLQVLVQLTTKCPRS